MMIFIDSVISIIANLIGYTLVTLTILLLAWCKINQRRQQAWVDATHDGSYLLAIVLGFFFLLVAGLCFIVSTNGLNAILQIDI